MSAAERERPVSLESSGHRLAGVIGAPASHAASASAESRGVVLIHGWGGYRVGPHRILVRTARRLNDAGHHTLRFDLRGRGDSDGDARATRLDDMIADTVAACACLKRETGCDRLTLLGICSGSNVAIGAATLKPGIADELALWSILPFQPDAGTKQRRRRAFHYLVEYVRKACRFETWTRLLHGRIDVKGVGKAIVGDQAPKNGERNLKDSARDIMMDFRKFVGRALFVTGSQDPEGMVGRELFREFCVKHPVDAAFHLVEGATHSYYEPSHAADVVETTLDWLLKR